MHKDFLNSVYSKLILFPLNLSIVHNLNVQRDEMFWISGLTNNTSYEIYGHIVIYAGTEFHIPTPRYKLWILNILITNFKTLQCK